VNGWSWYWLSWFCVWFTAFLIPEVIAIVQGTGNTLSENVWKLEQFRTGQPVLGWSAGHFLFAGVWLVTTIWLTGHFLNHKWA
jgi:hypothetical protein